MKIKNAHITFAKGNKSTKAGMILEQYDLVESCEIDRGKIKRINGEENTDILFKSCFIENCEYMIKDFKDVILPCPIVNNCIIKNCKLLSGYYVNCVFEKNGAREFSIPYS